MSLCVGTAVGFRINIKYAHSVYVFMQIIVFGESLAQQTVRKVKAVAAILILQLLQLQPRQTERAVRGRNRKAAVVNSDLMAMEELPALDHT